MNRICDLPKRQQKKIIKIYDDAFKTQPVPCGTDKCGWKSRGGCCHDCARCGGYLDTSVEKRNELQNTYGWTKETGFLEVGVGCKLPVSERSATCVGFTCGSMSEDQRNAGHIVYQALR